MQIQKQTHSKMATIIVKKPSVKTAVFEAGSYPISQRKVETSDTSSPPKQLLIIAPTTKGEYPVIIFLHGFALSNSFYTQLMEHVASHGYVVVAPQLYSLLPHSLPCSAREEIKSAAEVTNWLSKGLQSVLPENIKPIFEKLALAGHSRGGKTAFSLALDPGKISLKFSALVGVDPVLGFRKGYQIKPDILTGEPCSLDIGFPVMIIGTGLGGSCAPQGVNHENLYYESQPLCYHFVAAEYGHMDMLDDNLNLVGKLASCACKKGEGTKDAMRRCVGGLLVAFLEKCLDGESGDLEGILQDPSIAPVKLHPVELKSKNGISL